jgi:methyltransferase (TIGR00027 family)
VKPHEASRTAEFNALFRAIESARRPARARLFNDTLAHGFIFKLKFFYLVSLVPLMGRLMPLFIDWKWPGVRTSALGRTCLIDDLYRQALRDGARQVVILGAGYDSRAYRIAASAGVRIFEVDHPDTFEIKRTRLKELIGTIPGNVTLTQVDFNKEDFAAVLARSGFDTTKKTLFICEGVLHYLTEQAVDTTMRSIRALSAPGSRLVFTYIHKGLLDGTVAFGTMGRVPETLRKTGETWTFGFYPDQLGAYLRERGFTLVSDTGSTEYRTRYLGATKRNLKGFEFYRLAVAGVRDNLV